MEAAQPAVRERTPIRIGDREWDAEVRGGLVALKGRYKVHVYRSRKPRGRITSFSRRSRFRMFKMIATIDWSNAMKGLFVTLTFPDECWPHKAVDRMRWLAEWFRRMERYAGRPMSAIWRCEWVERKSGIHRGNVLPHFHLIIFDVQYLPWAKVRSEWCSTIGAHGYVRTETKRLRSKKDHGVYVAKYAAKLPDSSSLVNVSYSRIDGKHWGYHRGKGLPRYNGWYFEDISLANVQVLRDIADSELPWYDIAADAGFCLIGTIGEKLAKACLDLLLDSETPNG